MKAAAATVALGALLTLSAEAAPALQDRDVDTTYPYTGPAVPVGDWVDQSINGNGKGFARLVMPPAVKPASSNPTNNINVVSSSIFAGGVNIHFQTPFGIGANPVVNWGKTAESLTNTATGYTHTYDRTPPCSLVQPVTQCSQFFHDVRISGLEAGTTYYYQIPGGNGTTGSDVLSVTTSRAAGDKTPFNVGIVNDMGYTNAGDTYKQLQQLVDDGIAFAIHGGDLSYADDWNGGILECDNSDPTSVCYDGPDSRLPNPDAPIPADYLEPLPAGEYANQGSPRGGDTSPLYETNWDIWQQWISDVTMRVPYMALPGNHEASCGHHEDADNHTTAYLNFNETNSTASATNLNYWSCPPSQRNFTAYQHRFTMPGDVSGGVGNFWYSFDYGLVHFVFINTETDYPSSAEADFAMDVEGLNYTEPKPKDTTSTDSGPFGAVTGNITDNASYEQINWVASDLAAVNRNVTPWVVVMGHRPMYSSSTSSYQKHIRSAFESIFIENEIDVYIAGHIHWYERMLPLTLSGDIDESSVVNNNTYLSNPGKSITHITNGAAGNVQSHDILDGDPRLNISQVLDNYHYGLLNMTVYNETAIRFQYIFADDGSIGDNLLILKKTGSTGTSNSTSSTTHTSGSARPSATIGTSYAMNGTHSATVTRTISPASSSVATTQTITSLPVTVTTEVVTAYTTYCPGSTTFTAGSHTYTVTSATTLTITDCPCTITRTLGGSTVPTASATSSSIRFTNGTASTAHSSSPAASASLTGNRTSSSVTGTSGSASPTFTGAASRQAGAGLAMLVFAVSLAMVLSR